MQSWRISIAPMVGCSTRQMRYLWRQLCKSCLLYTEMVPVQSLLHGPQSRLLEYNELEKPLALQVAGNRPSDLATATKLAMDYNYDEINLNLGCPSCKLTHSGVGAAMIKDPRLSAECVAAMAAVAKIPVTVKTRLGVDDWDDDDKLYQFVSLLKQAGASRIIIHARKAWLKGLNPQQNRNLPPLQYARVARLQQALPDLPITLNGGINDFVRLDTKLKKFGSVMIGRWVYRNPLILQEIGRKYWGEDNRLKANDLIKNQLEYARQGWQEREEIFRRSGIYLLNLYNGHKGARRYRQELSILLQKKEPPPFSQIRPFIPQIGSGGF